MPFLTDNKTKQARLVSKLVACNPFLPDRIDIEKELLGKAYQPEPRAWNIPSAGEIMASPNLPLLYRLASDLAEEMRARLRPHSPSPAQWEVYEDVVLFHLYHKHIDPLIQEVIPWSATQSTDTLGELYTSIRQDIQTFFSDKARPHPSPPDAAHLLAIFFQIRRAFSHIYALIHGSSRAITRLRAGVWESIFTSDMGRYHRHLYRAMSDIPTLVLGPTGTGKELAARAIAHSSYIPYNKRKHLFEPGKDATFFAVNLSALSPTLVESDLFGHAEGAFTGASRARQGWLECCPPEGAVFLDEVGEVSLEIQVKLLRALQSRTFSRLGEVQTRAFKGKIIAATHRDLTAMIQEGNFREDFYYRLCSDILRTPSLREQLDEQPDDLPHLLRVAVEKLLHHPAERERFIDSCDRWISKHLPHHPWPGNFRELEQCVRALLVHGHYDPASPAPSRSGSSTDSLAHDMQDLRLTADELLHRYCSLAYQKLGSYEKAARALGLDRRTIKARIDFASDHDSGK